MIKNRDIVVVGIQAWDIEIGSNCKNIAQELSKNNRVLYVNYPLDRITKFRHIKSERVIKRVQILKRGQSEVLEISPNLWNLYPATLLESINWISHPGLFDFFNYINNKRYAKQIQHAIDQLGLKDIILFNDSVCYVFQMIFKLTLHLSGCLHPSVLSALS